MATLLELFDKEQSQIRQRISENPNSEKVVEVVKDFLDSLFVAYRTEKDRDPDQKRLSTCIVDLLKASISTLVAASETEIWRRNESNHSEANSITSNRFNLLLRVFQILLAVIALVLLYVERSFIYLGLVIGLVVIEIVRAVLSELKARSYYKDFQKKLENVRETESKLLKAAVHVNTDTLINKLADSVLAADKVLEEVLTIKKPANDNGLENDSAMLEFFQDLLRARDRKNSEFALLKTELIPHLLDRYGIQVEKFSGDNEHYFEFQENLNPNNTTYQTLKSAFVKGKRLIKRGLVEEPAGK